VTAASQFGNLQNDKSQRQAILALLNGTAQLPDSDYYPSANMTPAGRSEAVSITDYSPPSSTTSDAASAFQRFLDDSATVGGLTLHIPARSYTIGTELTYPTSPNGFIWQGSHIETSKVIVDTGTRLMDLATTSTRGGFFFRDMRIEASVGSSGIRFGDPGGSNTNIFRFHMERVRMVGAVTPNSASVWNTTTGAITRSGQTGLMFSRLFRSSIRACQFENWDYAIDLYECDHPWIQASFINNLTNVRMYSGDNSAFRVQHAFSGCQMEGTYLVGIAARETKYSITGGTRIETSSVSGNGQWDLTSHLSVTASTTEASDTVTLSGAIATSVIPLNECVLEIVNSGDSTKVERVIPTAFDGTNITVRHTGTNNVVRHEFPWTASGCTIRRVTGNAIVSQAAGGDITSCSIAPISGAYSIAHSIARADLLLNGVRTTKAMAIQGNWSAWESQNIGGAATTRVVVSGCDRAILPLDHNPLVTVAHGGNVRPTDPYQWWKADQDKPMERIARRFVLTPETYSAWITGSLQATRRIEPVYDEAITGMPVWCWRHTSSKTPVYGVPEMPNVARWGGGYRFTLICKATSATSKTISARYWNEVDGPDTSFNLATSNTSTAWQRFVWYSAEIPTFWSAGTRTVGKAAGLRVATSVSDLLVAAVIIEELIEGPSATLTYVFDGSGAAIPTGISGDLEVPFDCQIIGWTMLETTATSGSMVVDVWKDSYANFPPTVADTITASDKPTISSSTKGQGTALTGWTTRLSKGDIVRFNADSVTSCKRVTLSLLVVR